MATVTWTGDGVGNLASTGGNWSNGTGLSSSDDAVFDGVTGGTPNKNCTWDVTTNCTSIDFQAAYSGNVTLTAQMQASAGAGGYITWNGTGTFDANGQNLLFKSFDASGSSTKTLLMGEGTWTITPTAAGTLNLNGANLTYDKETSTVDSQSAGTTITMKSGVEFYKLTFTITGHDTLTLGSDIVVNNDFNATAAAGFNLTVNSNTMTLKGNVTTEISMGKLLGTTAIVLGGTGTVTLTKKIDNDITINTAGTVTFANSTHLFGGNFTYTAGTVVTGTSTVSFDGGKNVNSGTIGWNNFTTTADTGTVTLTGNLDVNAILTISSGSTLSCGSNTINLAGNFTRTGTFTAGTSTIIFDGTSTVAGTTTFNNFTIANTATVHLTSTQTFTVGGAFTTLGTSTLDAVTATSRANLSVNGSQSVFGVTATDIDSSGGSVKPIHNVGGTNSNTVQWDTSAAVTAIRQGMLKGVC